MWRPRWSIETENGFIIHYDNPVMDDAWYKKAWYQFALRIIALYGGNYRFPTNFPHRGSVMQSLDVVSNANLKNSLNKLPSCRWT